MPRFPDCIQDARTIRDCYRQTVDNKADVLHGFTSLPFLTNQDCLELARLVTDAALGTFVLIDNMRGLFFAGDRLDQAFTCANSAAVTFFGIDCIMKQPLANACRAFPVQDVTLIFGAKVA
jgi:hypothetical protein